MNILPFFGTFIALRHPNFRLFYTGQAISLTGSWMQSLALSWLILMLTNSSFYLGLIGALQTLPVLLLAFLAGVVTDSTSKHSMLFLTQTIFMILSLVLGVLVVEQISHIWLLCAVVLFSGMVTAFDIPVRQAFVVDLVGKRDLPNAIALNSTLFNATRVVGPALAGVIIAEIGLSNCFFLNAASFVAVLLALALMKLPPYEPTPWIPFRQAWRELGDHLRQRRELRLLLIIMSLVAIFAMPYYVLLPMLARDTLGVGPRGFGLLMAVKGLGALLGGLTLAWRLQGHPPMPLFLGGLLVMLVGLLGLCLCYSYPLALVFIFMVGFGLVAQLSTGNSLMQLNVPNKLRGRIMSLFGLIVIGFTPIGSLLYGGVALWLGPGPTIASGSMMVAILVGLVLIRHPEMLHFGSTELEPPEADPLFLSIPHYRH